MKGVILETLPPLQRESRLVSSTFNSESHQSLPRDQERMISLKDWEYSLEKNCHNPDSVQKRHRSATSRHKTDSEEKNNELFMENLDIFPMKPVCHKRAFNLNNYKAGEDKFSQKDQERLDGFSQRKQIRPLGKYLSRLEPSEPSSTKGYQTIHEDLHRLPENQMRMTKEIRRKEIILQEKLLKAEEELRNMQLRAGSGDKGRIEERNKSTGRVENRLYCTEKGNWEWENIQEHARGGRRYEGQRERFGDWGRNNKTHTERWEPKMDEHYRERRKEGPDWENGRRNTDRIRKKEWDLYEETLNKQRWEKDKTKRESVIEWDWRDWHEKERVHDGERRGDRAKPRRDMEKEHHEEQWNIMDTFKTNLHAKPKHDWRLTQERLQQQSRRTAEETTGNIQKVLSKEPPVQTVPQSPPFNQRSSRHQPVELSPERGLNDQLVPCRICNRSFTRDRLERHRRVCEKQQQSKRKTFDSAQYRAKGTDLEVFMKTNIQRKTPELKKNNWRQKHEALIQNLRQSRAPAPEGFQARSGPDVNPDYVKCPHCGRRFAPGPAERHIPKCQNIKSRPPPPPRHHH